MDGIAIPEEQIVPMDSIAPGVHGLRVTFVNVFGIVHADGSWTLIDAAIPLSETYIRRWAEKQFAKAPNGIALSHGHFDHVSCARGLAEHWNVPIFAHRLEFPYLTGRQEYPAPNIHAGGGVMPWLAPLFPRGPIDLGNRLREISGAGTGKTQLTELPGWQILDTPGHTPGHVSFFRAQDRTLLPADAFCTTKPESFFESNIAQHSELHGPPSYFTGDWSLAKQSVQKLAELEPLVVAPGHGQPVTGSTIPQALHELAARFEEIAVPDNRKSSAAR